MLITEATYQELLHERVPVPPETGKPRGLSRYGRIAAPWIAAIVLLLSCAGCGNSDARSQVQAMLDAYQHGNMAQMQTYTITGQIASANDDVQVAGGADSDFFNGSELIALIGQHSTFSVGKVTTSGGTATAAITAKTPDVAKIIADIASSPDAGSLSGDQLTAQLEQAIATGTTIQTQFDVSLEKVNGVWLVDSSLFAFKDGLTGGLYTGYQKLYVAAVQDIQNSIGG